MKAASFLWLFLCYTLIIKGQARDEFVNIDSRALAIPLAETYSTTSIAGFVQANFKTEKEKLRAIYSWITANISYDTDSMYAINLGRDPDARITAALRRRKGVCENYAAILNNIALKCGIRSFEVSGYTKQYGSVDKSAHVWCVVYLEGQWLFCDPTWDVGFNNYTKYFLINPSVFIESHMPFDPLWQLLDHPITHKEFYGGYSTSKKDKLFINYTDSVNAYVHMNELQQLEASVSRIEQEGIVNDLIKTRLAWLQMEISIIYQEKNMTTYNTAVAAFNNANDVFNKFIRYRNDRFIPEKPDQEINALLLPVDGMLLSAYHTLSEVDSTAANFQYDTGSLRNRLDALKVTVLEQKNFLKRYFASTVSERKKMFYQ